MQATLTDRTDIDRRAEELRARRPALALRAAQGDAGARQQLDDVDAQLVRLARDVELLGIADTEAARLAAVEADELQAAERRRLHAAIDDARAQQRAAFLAVEGALVTLLEHARAAVAGGDAIDQLSGQLGVSSPAAGLAARQGIAERIGVRFWREIGPGYLPVGAGVDRPLAAEGDPS